MPKKSVFNKTRRLRGGGETDMEKLTKIETKIDELPEKINELLKYYFMGYVEDGARQSYRANLLQVIASSLDHPSYNFSRIHVNKNKMG